MNARKRRFGRKRDGKKPTRRVDLTGRLGRSQAVSTYGVGAIYELRSSTQSGQVLNSVMVAGLDEWDRFRDHLPRIRERHLERVLGKRFFLAPPMEPDDGQDDYDFDFPTIPAVRFPRWLVCDNCERLGVVGREFEERGAGPRCRDGSCNGRGVPVRLVMACYQEEGGAAAQPGHIEDFPWSWWAHGGRACGSPQLKLRSTGQSAGLAGLRVVCESSECKPKGVGQSLNDVFSPDKFRGLRCRGRRPWLGDSEDCSRPVRVLMRGASNVYFSVPVSALSIPPNSGYLMQRIGQLAWVMNNYESMPIDSLVTMVKNSVHDLGGRYSDQQIADAIHAMATGEGSEGPVTDAEQRTAERTAIIEERNDENDSRSEFQVERIPDGELPPGLGSVTEHLVLANRLREVRVLRGFHRVESFREADPYHVECAPISRKELDWLPAVEVRGEGIYFELRSDRVREWEDRQSVSDRMGTLHRNVERIWAREGIDQSLLEKPAPRFVLAHTLCHLLINQLSLDCGYSSASLRERLYAGGGGSEDEWTGFLIYTASPGADGTLGGLVRQGEPDVFARTLGAALAGATWCSSDPLCIESTGQGADALNLAACHACCIVSETSCERRNLYLDRGLLVGAPEFEDAGFFTGTDLMS